MIFPLNELCICIYVDIASPVGVLTTSANKMTWKKLTNLFSVCTVHIAPHWNQWNITHHSIIIRFMMLFIKIVKMERRKTMPNQLRYTRTHNNQPNSRQTLTSQIKYKPLHVIVDKRMRNKIKGRVERHHRIWF